MDRERIDCVRCTTKICVFPRIRFHEGPNLSGAPNPHCYMTIFLQHRNLCDPGMNHEKRFASLADPIWSVKSIGVLLLPYLVPLASSQPIEASFVIAAFYLIEPANFITDTVTTVYNTRTHSYNQHVPDFSKPPPSSYSPQSKKRNYGGLP